jgi:methylmalonyl-CoA/ethylmalonyl-CoA epimerase
MFKILKIDHVSIAVDDLSAAAEVYERLFGLAAQGREYVESQKTETLFLPIGESSIELIAPKGNEGLARFLQKRGPGIHHVSLEVDDIEEALRMLKGLGVELIDEAPRIGARGHRVAFVHPKATGGVLVELLEAPSEVPGRP